MHKVATGATEKTGREAMATIVSGAVVRTLIVVEIVMGVVTVVEEAEVAIAAEVAVAVDEAAVVAVLVAVAEAVAAEEGGIDQLHTHTHFIRRLAARARRNGRHAHTFRLYKNIIVGTFIWNLGIAHQHCALMFCKIIGENYVHLTTYTLSGNFFDLKRKATTTKQYRETLLFYFSLRMSMNTSQGKINTAFSLPFITAAFSFPI